MDFLTGGGRIGRLRFLLIGALLGASLAVTAQWTTYLHPVTDELVIEPAGYAVAATFLWLQAMNGVRRLHDRSHSGYLIAFSLLPGVNLLLWLYLVFAPSSPSSNKWGPNPFSNPYRSKINPTVDPAKELARRERANQQFLNDDGSYDFDGLFKDREAGPAKA